MERKGSSPGGGREGSGQWLRAQDTSFGLSKERREESSRQKEAGFSDSKQFKSE